MENTHSGSRRESRPNDSGPRLWQGGKRGRTLVTHNDGERVASSRHSCNTCVRRDASSHPTLATTDNKTGDGNFELEHRRTHSPAILRGKQGLADHGGRGIDSVADDGSSEEEAEMHSARASRSSSRASTIPSYRDAKSPPPDFTGWQRIKSIKEDYR